MLTNKCSTLNLEPGCLHLEMYAGMDDEISVYRRDTDTGAQLTLTGWVNARAVMRRTRGGAVVVDLLPTINGDAIDIDITPAMKTALGATNGVWEVDIENPDGKEVTLVQGDVSIKRQVVTS